MDYNKLIKEELRGDTPKKSIINDTVIQEILELLSDSKNILLNEKLEQRYSSHIDKITKIVFVHRKTN